MSMFAKKVAQAQPNEGTGLFFLEGRYPIVQVMELKCIVSKNPKHLGAEKFIIVGDILESLVVARPTGMRGVCQILNSNHPGAADDCKRFITACLPMIDPNTIDEDGIVALTSAEQPAAGRLMSLECYEKKNEKNGNVFTKHIWRSLDESTQAHAAELRAKAGLPALGSK